MPLDLVPRILSASEWTAIKRGIAQRIRALNRFVDDVYHAREIVRAGIVPWRLVVSQKPLRARRARHPAAGRRLLPRRRLRPRARRRRLLEGARGQRPHALRDLLRAREPHGDDAPRAAAVRRVPRAPGRPLPDAAARRAARRRARRRGRGDGRRLDARPAELRLLRARLPRAPDGRRARRGVRPRRARRRPVHAHDAGPAARARRLPAPGRRLRRPARVPPRLGARRARPHARLPRGHGRAGQRRRHRRRRRQGDLPLGAGDDPLLPRRGADPRQRHDVPHVRSEGDGALPRPDGRARLQADRRVGRQGRLHRARRRTRSRSPAWPTSSASRRRSGSPRSSCACRPCRPPTRTACSRRATSTCARSPSSARRSRSCRAGCRGWRWSRAR